MMTLPQNQNQNKAQIIFKVTFKIYKWWIQNSNNSNRTYNKRFLKYKKTSLTQFKLNIKKLKIN